MSTTSKPVIGLSAEDLDAAIKACDQFRFAVDGFARGAAEAWNRAFASLTPWERSTIVALARRQSQNEQPGPTEEG